MSRNAAQPGHASHRDPTRRNGRDLWTEWTWWPPRPVVRFPYHQVFPQTKFHRPAVRSEHLERRRCWTPLLGPRAGGRRQRAGRVRKEHVAGPMGGAVASAGARCLGLVGRRRSRFAPLAGGPDRAGADRRRGARRGTGCGRGARCRRPLSDPHCAARCARTDATAAHADPRRPPSRPRRRAHARRGRLATRSSARPHGPARHASRPGTGVAGTDAQPGWSSTSVLTICASAPRRRSGSCSMRSAWRNRPARPPRWTRAPRASRGDLSRGPAAGQGDDARRCRGARRRGSLRRSHRRGAGLLARARAALHHRDRGAGPLQPRACAYGCSAMSRRRARRSRV